MLKPTHLIGFIFILNHLQRLESSLTLATDRDIIIEKILGYHLTNPTMCSDYFQYVRTDDFINGKLTLPNIKFGDNITVKFYQSPFNENPRFQGIILPNEKSETLIRKVKEGKPIIYRVDFPVVLRPPELEKIIINGKEICEDTYTDFGQRLLLNHTLEIINGSIPVFEDNINIPNFKEDPFCGISEVESTSNDIAPLAYNSTNISRGEYPWLAGIYQKKNKGILFMCGGSLVSSQVILTAAHCLQNEDPAKFVVLLGRYNLTNFVENSVETREIESVIFHPEYKRERELSDADLVLLKMKEPIIYSRFIKAICLWSESVENSLVGNLDAVVAGWATRFSAVPRKAKINIIPDIDCERNANNSIRFLCAGPCQKDSGDVLMFNRNGVWMLRGVISETLFESRTCDSNENITYTDIAKHSAWLKKYVEPQQTIIRSSSKAICGKSGTEPRNKYPWLAAIYLKTTTGFLFHCTGALISSRTVLVPAHRFDLPLEYVFPAKLFQIFLGRYDLNNIKEGTVWSREASAILLHPEYQWNSSFLGYDVALLQMDNPVRFTQNIKPICLWSEFADRSKIVDETATLASWDWRGVFDESLTVPESMKVNIADITQCQLWEHNVTSASRFLCTPRFGNNVDGILMLKRFGRWLIRGISAVEYEYYWDRNNSKPFRVYSDIAEYLPWIQKNTLL